jgi:hypothetical protein
MCGMRAVAVALACAGFLSGSWARRAVGGDALAPQAAVGCREVAPPLPVARGVRDPVFAILVGLVDADVFGYVSGAGLAREIRSAARSTRLPYQRLREVARQPATDGATARVSVLLDGPLVTPIPYRLLFYRPGRIRADTSLELTEWDLGDLGLAPATAGSVQTAAAPTDVRIFAISEGGLDVDIDGWLDTLAGPRLDDTRLTGLALFRMSRRWWGVGFGHNRKKEPRVGLFDLAADEVVFPLPSSMRPWMRRLREELDARSRGRWPEARR